MTVGPPSGQALPAYHKVLPAAPFFERRLRVLNLLERQRVCSKKCLRVAQCPSFVKRSHGGSTVPSNASVLHDFVINPGDHLQYLVYDQAGIPRGTGLCWIAKRWRSNASGWIVEGLHVECSNPMGELFLSQLLPPRGLEVPHASSAPGWFGRVESLPTAT